jgi:hypothetical protein
MFPREVFRPAICNTDEIGDNVIKTFLPAGTSRFFG